MNTPVTPSQPQSPRLMDEQEAKLNLDTIGFQLTKLLVLPENPDWEFAARLDMLLHSAAELAAAVTTYDRLAKADQARDPSDNWKH